MYYYIFESNKLDRTRVILVEKIQDFISELGIAGEISTPSSLKPLDVIVHEAKEKRYSTIVAVGGIKHITAVASLLVGSDLVFGTIPISDSPNLNKILKIQNWKEAAQALKTRRFIEARLGVIEPGFHVFLTSCELPAHKARSGYIQFPLYRVEFTSSMIQVRLNQSGSALIFDIIPVGEASISSKVFNFFGKTNPAKKTSTFTEKKGFIKTDPVASVSIEEVEIAQTPVNISLVPKQLKLIVGKNFKFN